MPWLAQLVEHPLAFDEVAGDVQRVGQPRRAAAVDLRRRGSARRALLQAVAQARGSRASSSSWSSAASSQRLGQADDVGHVLGAGAAAFLLVPADQERPAGRAAADEQRADALRRVQLVAGEREQVDVPELAAPGRSAACPPICVASVWKTIAGSVSLVEPRELLDGKDHAGLVVGVHDRDQQRVGPQRADELADVEVARRGRPAGRSRRSRRARGPCRLRARPDARRRW